MSDKFEFIDAEYAATFSANIAWDTPSVTQMCGWLNVSRSGFDEWRTRPASATARRREELKLLITKSFDDSGGTHGYRRVHADLAGWEVACGPELVRDLMRELGLVACQPRPWRHGLTVADEAAPVIADLVGRDFTAARPGEKLIGDITYVPTWQGWVYLATVIDCFNKEVIGWAIDDNYKTPLIDKAIAMAAGKDRIAPGAVFHSDRGSNYTSRQFTATLQRHDIRQSVGRTGSCFDNAMAESFFAALKNERVHRTEYPTREHARRDVIRYIEFWYNRRRRHSGLDYKTPLQVYNEYEKRQLAA
ncbi:MAG: IS3 family transposase [Stackebrandtia sp.]